MAVDTCRGKNEGHLPLPPLLRQPWRPPQVSGSVGAGCKGGTSCVGSIGGAGDGSGGLGGPCQLLVHTAAGTVVVVVAGATAAEHRGVVS